MRRKLVTFIIIVLMSPASVLAVSKDKKKEPKIRHAGAKVRTGVRKTVGGVGSFGKGLLFGHKHPNHKSSCKR